MYSDEPMNPREIFAKNAKKRMEVLGITQAQLQERLHAKSRSSVTNYLTGDTDPGLDVVCRWAEALETTVELLLEGTERETLEQLQLRAITLILQADSKQVEMVLSAFKIHPPKS